MPEDMLDCPGGDMFSLLPDEEGADNTVTNELQDLGKGILINKDGTDFIPFSPDPDGVLIEVDVLDIDTAEF